MVFVAGNGLRSDLKVYSGKLFMAGVCTRSCSKTVFPALFYGVTHALSVPMLCQRNLLILATPLCLIAKYLICAKRKLITFTATWIPSQIKLLITFIPIWLPTKLVLIVVHTPQLYITSLWKKINHIHTSLLTSSPQ